MTRLTRSERANQNRARVLAAAGNLFRLKGFHGATLDEIAEEAGFSKGVIYSQFGGKDDLFLALLEQRQAWRLDQALEYVRSAPPGAGLRELWEHAREVRQADIPMVLLILEFRIHAARNPDVNRRYAAIHAKILEGLAHLFEALVARTGRPLRQDPADLARFIATLEYGGALEALIEGPGQVFEISRHATWLLLTEPQGDAADADEDAL